MSGTRPESGAIVLFRYARRCHSFPLCVYINGWKPSGLHAQQCGCGLTLGRSFTFKLTFYRYTDRGSHVEGSSRCHSPQLSSFFSQNLAEKKQSSPLLLPVSSPPRLGDGFLFAPSCACVHTLGLPRQVRAGRTHLCRETSATFAGQCFASVFRVRGYCCFLPSGLCVYLGSSARL